MDHSGDTWPESDVHGHVKDYDRIEEFIWLGSDLCNPFVCNLHADEFKKIGVLVEISLTAEKKDTPPDNIEHYSWIPVVDDTPPNIYQLDAGTSIIHQAVLDRKPVYVHCQHGHGRSPTLVAAYYVRYRNMSARDALLYVKSRRPEIHPTRSQVEALEKYAERWSK